ncbi:uncharacterized protein [Epargyreus clarus]|uniref:uncharacterized protein n=1 Tax=Epargyreus clarus TaxID=520877 RepID=UPI003C2ACD53
MIPTKNKKPDNFLDKEIQAILKPLNVIQYLCFLPKYTIRNDVITKNNFLKNIILFYSAILIFNCYHSRWTAYEFFCVIFLIYFDMNVIYSSRLIKFMRILLDWWVEETKYVSDNFTWSQGVVKGICKNVLRMNRVVFEKMDACGLFVVDSRLPLNLLSYIANYIIVLLQFAVASLFG